MYPFNVTCPECKALVGAPCAGLARGVAHKRRSDVAMGSALVVSAACVVAGALIALVFGPKTLAEALRLDRIERSERDGATSC